MQKWVTFARREIARENNGVMRPYLDSEHGPIYLLNDHRKFLSEENDDTYERHLVWAHLASGGAGSGMRWPACHPHVITPGMQSALQSLRDFSRLIDWRLFSPHVGTTEDPNSGVFVQNEHGAVPIHLFACRDETQIIAWLLRRSEENGWEPARTPQAPSTCTLHVPNASARSEWHVTVWDTLCGARVYETKIGADATGTVFFNVPDALWQGREDLALIIA